MKSIKKPARKLKAARFDVSDIAMIDQHIENGVHRDFSEYVRVAVKFYDDYLKKNSLQHLSSLQRLSLVEKQSQKQQQKIKELQDNIHAIIKHFDLSLQDLTLVSDQVIDPLINSSNQKQEVGI